MDKREQKRLLDALEALQHEDDGLSLRVSQWGERVLHCTGPLHLELVRERLAEDFKILQLRLGKPQVEYQATLKSITKAKGSHVPIGKVRMRKGVVHHGGGGAPDAWVTVEMSPGARSTGVEVEGVGQGTCQVPADAAGALELGIKRGLQQAGPGKVPLTDVVVRVTGAEAKCAETAADAAADAVEAAVQKAVQEGPGVTLLEPVADLELDVPVSFVEMVTEDLQHHRRGQVWDARDAEEGHRLIEAEAPVREILDYASQLQKLTDGQGVFSYRTAHYREVGRPLVEDILRQELHVSASD
jgi:elongation factor G